MPRAGGFRRLRALKSAARAVPAETLVPRHEDSLPRAIVSPPRRGYRTGMEGA